MICEYHQELMRRGKYSPYCKSCAQLTAKERQELKR